MESLKSLVEPSTNKKLEYYELLRIGEFAFNVLSSHRADENTLEYAQSLLQSVLQEFETQVDALTPAHNESIIFYSEYLTSEELELVKGGKEVFLTAKRLRTIIDKNVK